MMGHWLRRIGLALTVLVLLAAALALWQRERLIRLMAVNTLFSADRIVSNFSHMDELFLTAPLPRGDGASAPCPPARPWTCRPRSTPGSTGARSPPW